MLHPSTQKLIAKLHELTMKGELDWQEGPEEWSFLESEGYRVEVLAEPAQVRLMLASGRELEACSTEKLSGTPAGDGSGRNFHELVAEMGVMARRYAIGAEDAITTLLTTLPGQRHARRSQTFLSSVLSSGSAPSADAAGDAPAPTAAADEGPDSPAAMALAVSTLAERLNRAADNATVATVRESGEPPEHPAATDAAPESEPADDASVVVAAEADDEDADDRPDLVFSAAPMNLANFRPEAAAPLEVKSAEPADQADLTTEAEPVAAMAAVMADEPVADDAGPPSLAPASDEPAQTVAAEPETVETVEPETGAANGAAVPVSVPPAFFSAIPAASSFVTSFHSVQEASASQADAADATAEPADLAGPSAMVAPVDAPARFSDDDWVSPQGAAPVVADAQGSSEPAAPGDADLPADERPVDSGVFGGTTSFAGTPPPALSPVTRTQAYHSPAYHTKVTASGLVLGTRPAAPAQDATSPAEGETTSAPEGEPAPQRNGYTPWS